MPSNTACAQAHAFHTPGYDATLSEYTRKFGHAPPQSIWGIMGESAGCGSSCGGSSCGGSSGGGGGGGGSLVMYGLIGWLILIVYVFWPLAKQVCGDGGDCNGVTRLGNVLCVDIESTNASGQSKPWVSTNTRTGTGHTCQQYHIQGKCNLCKEKGPDWDSDWGEFRDYATRMPDGGGLGCRGEGGSGAMPRSRAQNRFRNLSCHVLLSTHFP